MTRLLLTVGDPAGIGPELVLAALAEGAEAPVTVVGDPALLQRAGEAIGCVPPWLDGAWGGVEVLAAGEVPASFERATASADGGRAALAALEAAADVMAAGDATALVTAPIHKGALALAGADVTGHTTWLARRFDARPVMAFDAADPRGGALRVALVTIHIPLAEVPGALRVDDIVRTGRVLAGALPGSGAPRIGVLGLNPHAGEGGLLGDDERRLVAPAVAALREGGLDVVGPLPPDTAFVPDLRGELDGYVALYHDQGLIPVKTLAFHDAAQVTLGLPWLRTSVAHGTAFDRVGRAPDTPGGASTASLRRALALARDWGEP